MNLDKKFIGQAIYEMFWFFPSFQRALLREKRQRHNQPMMVQPNEERQGSGGKSRRKTAEETRPLVSPAHSSSASDGLQGMYLEQQISLFV